MSLLYSALSTQAFAGHHRYAQRRRCRKASGLRCLDNTACEEESLWTRVSLIILVVPDLIVSLYIIVDILRLKLDARFYNDNHTFTKYPRWRSLGGFRVLGLDAYPELIAFYILNVSPVRFGGHWTVYVLQRYLKLQLLVAYSRPYFRGKGIVVIVDDQEKIRSQRQQILGFPVA
ncbi:hypothetical protein EDD18DRAFT_1102040 [Armillaria luteobubalina]|uniref:Uncharacterized protein n=1 Tax=Armillaria luteobubalina TaxID=153913 RepID=A0AA39V0X5_9AGAR|nr:hypothetical protein EDD18DRAFT_1102040 [Armillaria luteobubalina]